MKSIYALLPVAPEVEKEQTSMPQASGVGDGSRPICTPPPPTNVDPVVSGLMPATWKHPSGFVVPIPRYGMETVWLNMAPDEVMTRTCCSVVVGTAEFGQIDKQSYVG